MACKVREGEQINVLCCNHNKLVVFWLLCIEQKIESLVSLCKENKLKWANTEWEIYLL